jgi:hypothetical protein
MDMGCSASVQRVRSAQRVRAGTGAAAAKKRPATSSQPPLVERDALRPPDGHRDELVLGEDRSAFADLGVDVEAVRPGRRKLATACLDKTHRLPHLGGALGKAVLDAFLDHGLVETDPDGTRLLTVTAAGRAELPRMLPAFTPS